MAHGQMFYNQIRSGGAQIKTGNYTIIESDAWSDIVANSAGAITITLPATPPSSVFKVYIENIGAGICTIARNGHNIDGAASNVVLNTNQGVVIFTDGTNWFTAGQPSASGLILQTNGVNNGNQGKLNLVSGTNVTLTDNGTGSVTIAASGSGGGVPWLNITNPTLTTFGWRNQGGASINALGNSIYMSIPAVAGNNVRGREIAASAAPFSITVGLIPQLQIQNFHACWVYVTDGTKLIMIGCESSSTGGTSANLLVARYNNVTSGNSVVAQPGQLITMTPIFLKIQDDGTNLNFSWSPDGNNFIKIYSELRTAFLASVANFGWGGETNNGTWPLGVLCVSFATGT